MYYDNIKEYCTGCTACKNICPQACITFIRDNEGFLHPHMINQEHCINCGMCEKVCPVINKPIMSDRTPIFYAAWAKDDNIRKNSSSGGIFSVIAELILSQNGRVAGCYLDSHNKARHIIVEHADEVALLRGSKYIQSDLKDTFKMVKKLLNQKKTVLFTGTPCQVAGLKSFLVIDYENLYTIDLICHGVPSPKIFSKYVSWQSRKVKARITDFSFRDKEKCGWSLTNSFYANRKKVFQNANLNPYYYGYTEGYFYRNCCYHCPYARKERIGDITLGDFWGIDEFYDIADIDLGISLVIVNSSKGDFLFKRIENQITCIPSDYEKAKKRNQNLAEPFTKPILRNTIYKELDEKGFAYIATKYLTPKHILVERMKFQIPMPIKRKIIAYWKKKSRTERDKCL